MASQDPTEQVNDGPPPRSSEAVARAGPPVFTPARRLGTSTLVEGKVSEFHPLSLSRYERRAKGRRPRGAWKERLTVPEADLPHFSGHAVSAATTLPEIGLEEADRKVVEALFQGYLRPGPRCQPRPRTYAEAAQWLGDDWTAARVRKRVERLKLRLSRNGPPFDDR